MEGKASGKGKADGTERLALKRYLCRYYKIRERKAILQNRLEDICRQESEQGGTLAGALAERVRIQAAEAEQAALDIQSVIDLLPVDSTERTIMELRHIDCKPWREIRETIHYTKTPCFNYYNRGLDTLLRSDKVRYILISQGFFSSGKKPARVDRSGNG